MTELLGRAKGVAAAVGGVGIAVSTVVVAVGFVLLTLSILDLDPFDGLWNG